MNRSRLLLVSVAGWTFAAPLKAEDAAVNTPSETGSYQLQAKSTFELPADSRSPFWPIGWSPTKIMPVTKVVEPKKAVLDAKDYALTSILLGVPSLAVINGRAYSEGEFLKIPKKGEARRIRVQRITDGNVTLQHEEEVLVVLLRRLEAGTKKPAGQELLIDER